LCYPEIHFKLIHDEIPIINSPATENYVNILFDLFGKEVAKKVVEFTYNDEKINIHGYLGDPSLSRSSGLSSSVFVNNRYVQSPLINEALDEAYKDYVMVKKHPFYIIFLTLNPASVDFNIHPTKKIIRFENENELLHHLIVILKEVVNEKFGKFKSEKLIKSSLESYENEESIESIAKSVPIFQNNVSRNQRYIQN
jgi:DNA mismatch repair protein MutL